MLPNEFPPQLHEGGGGICFGILNVAWDAKADLIIVASHGPPARDYLLGSNDSHFPLHAACPGFVAQD